VNITLLKAVMQIVCIIGIGKTTLANEICMKWAKDGFLAEDFDVVVLIPLRSVRERSVEAAMVRYIGEKRLIDN